jgi:hypothetical protein
MTKIYLRAMILTYFQEKYKVTATFPISWFFYIWGLKPLIGGDFFLAPL